jgi:3-phenylpropionate/trans-cinnamate dioxygenase ferredoxin subunit
MEWIRVFSSIDEAKSRLAGRSTQLLIIGRERICLATFNDEFYAVQDACSHNGESLSKGAINFAGEIVCPWHNYRFDLRTGRACDSDCRDLKRYPLKWDGTGFFIGI